MANSLMELYGGGMAGKSTNYQLGGRIASAKRRRGFQGEMRELREKQEASNRRKKKSGFFGSIGSLAGGALGAALAPVTGGLSLALATGLGAGLGRAAGESSYAREDYSGGKYAQDTRGSLRDAEDDYRAGIGERALVSGLQAAIMPGIYDKAGSFLKGLGGAGEAATTAATTAADITGTVPELAAEFGGAPVYEGMASGGFKLSGPPKIGTPPSMAMEGFGSDIAGKLSTIPSEVSSVMPEFLSDEALSSFSDTLLGDFSNIGLPSQLPSSNNLAALAGYYGPYINKQGGMIPEYSNGGQVNQYGVNTNALSNLSSSGFNMGNFLGGALFGDGSGINLGFQDAMQSRNPAFGPAAGAAGGGFGPGSYGTSTGVMGALSQMGMSDVANDPRFKEYLEDLPQFGMGYSQQIGDIYGSAGQQAGGIRGGARQAAGKSGFAGSGAVQAASQKALGNLGTETARQRRGVVEGYQADLLSAIGDIEAKGEFEFGQDIPDETNNTTTNVNPPPTSAALYDGHTITQGGIKWQWNGSNWENMGAG